MFDAVAIQLHLGRLGDRVVVTDDFNGTAIAGAFLVNHNHAVGGLCFGAKPRQANC
jgi:hypothetical protein